MITIIERKKDPIGFVVYGHANSAVRGEDIVCSAVSAVTQTALLGLLKHCVVSYAHREGYIDVEIYSNNGVEKIILETMFDGLIMIQKLYPDYIRFKEEAEWEKQEDLKS